MHLARSRTLRRGVALLFATGAIVTPATARPMADASVGGAGHSPTSRSTTPLAVIPFPGTPDASPASQIIFSALPLSALRRVTVTGSRSGLHSGRLSSLPGGGAAFVPARGFVPGERVTVSATLSSERAGLAAGDPGSAHLAFSFGVARAAPDAAPPGGRASDPPTARPAAHQPSWQTYRSEHGLHPPLVHLSHPAPGRGDFFLSPVKSHQMGPLIVNRRGQLVWFHHTGRPTPFNFEVQHYRGHPVLTWWQGKIRRGHGNAGQDMILDSSYHTVAALHGGYGYSSDLHEFQITPQDTALVDAYVPVHANLSSVGGPSNGTVLDCVIQELDIRTNRVLWEWHAYGHVPLSASYNPVPSDSTPFDFFHLNSIQQLGHRKLIISARNTWAVYMIDERTGRVQWTLGGKNSSYRMGPGTNFEWQHDARLHRHGILTVFDDGSYPPVESESSAKELKVNVSTGYVSLVRRFTHSPPLLAGSQGNVQLLNNGDVVVGWGASSAFSEYSRGGRQIADGGFRLGVNSYRTYRFPWTGRPTTRPSLAVVPRADGSTRLYASWNGATEVASWQILSGASRHAMTPLAVRRVRGFETAMTVPDEPRLLAVRALDSHGRVLGRSRTVPTRPHMAVFGHLAFASRSTGVAQIPVGCFAHHSCHFSLGLTAGRSSLGPLRHAVLRRGGALVPFGLSRSARHMLAHTRRSGIAVTVRAAERSGLVATRQLRLFGYSTSGRSPPRSRTDSPTIRLASTSGFVGLHGHGGILAICYGPTACYVDLTLSAGGMTISHPAIQRLGANEVAYLRFVLTPAGRSMLNRAAGNQLAASLTMRDRKSLATGQIVLSRYG